MKKVLMSLFVAIAIMIPANAASYNAANRVPTVGVNLLDKNGIPSANIKFTVVSGAVDNSNYATDKVVNISSAELSYAGNDNEVAAIVANELGHIISGHASKGKVVSLFTGSTQANSASTTSSILSNYQYTKEEKEADIIATNLMVSAGYNPLAIIVVLTKQTGTYWESIQGKPANADRAMSVYNYVSYAYPDKVKAGYGCNEYRNFLTYANPIVEERNADKKQLSKYEKEQSKLKKNSNSQLTKFKTRGGISAWDAVFGILSE